jgi:hypothetical protein
MSLEGANNFSFSLYAHTCVPAGLSYLPSAMSLEGANNFSFSLYAHTCVPAGLSYLPSAMSLEGANNFSFSLYAQTCVPAGLSYLLPAWTLERAVTFPSSPLELRPRRLILIYLQRGRWSELIILVSLFTLKPVSPQVYPLITPTGLILATFRVMPSLCITSTTSETSLYASDISSAIVLYPFA